MHVYDLPAVLSRPPAVQPNRTHDAVESFHPLNLLLAAQSDCLRRAIARVHSDQAPAPSHTPASGMPGINFVERTHFEHTDPYDMVLPAPQVTAPLLRTRSPRAMHTLSRLEESHAGASSSCWYRGCTADEHLSGMLMHLGFVRDHNVLAASLGANVLCDARCSSGVQHAVDLVKEVEGRGVGRLQRKGQRQRCQRLLAPAQSGERAPSAVVRPAGRTQSLPEGTILSALSPPQAFRAKCALGSLQGACSA